MAIQITDCLMYKAAKGNEEDYQNYINLLIENIKEGRLLQISCNCDPPCERPTQQEDEIFNQRLKNEWWYPSHMRSKLREE